MNNTTTFEELIGLRLLGVMEGKEENECNTVYLYIGYADEFTCYKVESCNEDYCHYSDWSIERCEPPVRDARYKAIGEMIRSVEEFTGEGHGDGDMWGTRISMVTKIMHFSCDNFDCCYVDSLWDIQ